MVKNRTGLKRLLFVHAAAGGAALPEYEITGNPITFETDIAKPLKGFIIPISSASGVSGIDVYQSGPNLFDEQYPNIQTGSGAYYRHYYVGNAESVTMSSDIPMNSTGGRNLFLLAGAVNTGATTNGNGISSGVTRTVVPVDGWITVAYRIYNGADPTASHTILVYGSSPAAQYEPYNGRVMPVSWADQAGSITAGSFDAVSGVLTATAPSEGVYNVGKLDISTLVGINNFWTETNGTNTIKYLKRA